MSNERSAESTEKVYGLLGLCMRAGQLISGESSCELAVREGKAAMVLLDDGASPNLLKKFQDACAYRNVALYLLESGCVGQAIGKPERMVVVIRKGSIAEQLLSLLAI